MADLKWDLRRGIFTFNDAAVQRRFDEFVAADNARVPGPSPP